MYLAWRGNFMATKSTTNTRKKAPTYHSRPKFLHRFSHQQLLASIVVLGVAFIGVLTLLFSSADTPVGVKVVLFCPPSGYTCNGSTATETSYIRSVQSWYATQLGSSRTFKLGTVSVHYARYAPSYYQDTSTTTAGHLAALGKLSSELGISDTGSNSTKTVVVMGFQMMHQYCGYSRVPGAMPVVDAVACNYPTLLPSLMGHELGHSFGLAYNGNAPNDPIHRTDGSLMTSNACGNKALSSCILNATDRSYLLANQAGWFPPPAAPKGTLSCAHNSTNITLVVNYANTSAGVYLYKNSALLTALTSTSATNYPVSAGTVTPHVNYTFVMTTRSSSPVELARITCATL